VSVIGGTHRGQLPDGAGMIIGELMRRLGETELTITGQQLENASLVVAEWDFPADRVTLRLMP
jgi:hypothetical protein